MATSPSLRDSFLSMLDGGVTAGILVALGAWGGSWLDGRCHSAPWWSLGLALLGGGLGMARMIVKALKLNTAEPVTPAMIKSAEKSKDWDDADD